MSATLGRSFCLAMLADGRAKLGQTIYTVGLEGAIRQSRRADVLRQGGLAP